MPKFSDLVLRNLSEISIPESSFLLLEQVSEAPEQRSIDVSEKLPYQVYSVLEDLLVKAVNELINLVWVGPEAFCLKVSEIALPIKTR